jgi:hypothetical protein
MNTSNKVTRLLSRLWEAIGGEVLNGRDAAQSYASPSGVASAPGCLANPPR